MFLFGTKYEFNPLKNATKLTTLNWYKIYLSLPQEWRKKSFFLAHFHTSLRLKLTTRSDRTLSFVQIEKDKRDPEKNIFSSSSCFLTSDIKNAWILHKKICRQKNSRYDLIQLYLLRKFLKTTFAASFFTTLRGSPKCFVFRESLREFYMTPTLSISNWLKFWYWFDLITEEKFLNGYFQKQSWGNPCSLKV